MSRRLAAGVMVLIVALSPWVRAAQDGTRPQPAGARYQARTLRAAIDQATWWR